MSKSAKFLNPVHGGGLPFGEIERIDTLTGWIS